MAKMRPALVDDELLPPGVLERLQHFLTLERNWDSYDAEPISPVAVDGAKLVVLQGMAALVKAGVANAEPYFIAPGSDGGVQVEWRSTRGELEIEIGPSGEISLLLIQFEASGEKSLELEKAEWASIERALLAVAA